MLNSHVPEQFHTSEMQNQFQQNSFEDCSRSAQYLSFPSGQHDLSSSAPQCTLPHSTAYLKIRSLAQKQHMPTSHLILVGRIRSLDQLTPCISKPCQFYNATSPTTSHFSVTATLSYSSLCTSVTDIPRPSRDLFTIRMCVNNALFSL